MHVVAAKGRNYNQIVSRLEVENRGCSFAAGFAASRSQHHKGKFSERVAQFSAAKFPQPCVKSPDQANRPRL
jgi:hypothetical protein